MAIELQCQMITADIKFINRFSGTELKKYILNLYEDSPLLGDKE